MTLGDIARIKVDKGDVDAALALHEEELKVYESLGDSRSRAVTLSNLGSIFMQTDAEKALPYFAESFEIAARLGNANGIVQIGLGFGFLLLQIGQLQAEKTVLTQALQAFALLGGAEEMALIDGWLAQLSAAGL